MTLIARSRNSFDALCREVRGMLLKTIPVMTGEWQSQDISDKPMLATREILNFSFDYKIPTSQEALAEETEANLPWAEDHFQERVSGEPLNPPPSNEWWPFAQQGNADHKKGEIFSHTYPERMWPKRAGHLGQRLDFERMGIRFALGDLEDVVQQLIRGPLTRQAFLPIWFPEDTGAAHGERVPCTIGYHFMIRNGALQITYYIRSCDFVRHFRDDVYMASRLAQWMVARLNEAAGDSPKYRVGNLIMHIVSFHCFEGDVPKLQQEARFDRASASRRLMEALG